MNLKKEINVEKIKNIFIIILIVIYIIMPILKEIRITS